MKENILEIKKLIPSKICQKIIHYFDQRQAVCQPLQGSGVSSDGVLGQLRKHLCELLICYLFLYQVADIAEKAHDEIIYDIATYRHGEGQLDYLVEE